MNWSLYGARALQRRLEFCGVPRHQAWREAFLDAPSTLARIETIARMDFDEVVSASLSGRLSDQARADTERQPLNEATAGRGRAGVQERSGDAARGRTLSGPGHAASVAAPGAGGGRPAMTNREITRMPQRRAGTAGAGCRTTFTGEHSHD